VCAQDIILLCYALNLKQDYKDLVSVIVCSTENKMCMIRRCRSCPREDILYQFLTDKLTGESTDNILYMQWQSTDQTTLKTLAELCSTQMAY